MNVAVVVGGGLAETLMAAPLLSGLAEGGDHRLLLLAPPAAARLAPAMPHVDEVVTLSSLDDPGSFLLGATVALRRRRVDAAILCSDRPRDRALPYLAGCARRVGLRRGAWRALLTSRIDTPGTESDGAAWLRLGAALGAVGRPAPPYVHPGPEARRRAEEILLGAGLEDGGRILVAIAPRGLGDLPQHRGTPTDRRWWDLERYAHLANALHTRHGAALVVIGAPAREAVDRMLLDVVAPHLDLSGELDLIETAAVLERCDLVVSGDSALIHLAAAVGTATVGLFGATDGGRRGAFGQEHRVVQAVRSPRQQRRALQAINVEDVVAAIEGAG